jgi:hypothetical protein
MTSVLKFTKVMLSEDGNEMGAPAVQYLMLNIKLEVDASMTEVCGWCSLVWWQDQSKKV